MIKKRKLAVDLFSGVGGLSLGLEAAGFEIALAVENDRHTVEQYRKNFPHTWVLSEDVSRLSGDVIRSCIHSRYSWIPQIDLICGGPPCQGFSRMGRRDLSDQRNQLIWHFMRLVKELQPRTFIMENVAFLKDPRYAELLSNAFSQLSSNYKTSTWLLDAKDFGVPQSRKRAFLVGALSTIISLPPLSILSFSQITVEDAIADLVPLEPLLKLDSDSVEISHLVHHSDYSLQLDNFFVPQDKLIAPQILTGCALTQHSLETIARFKATLPGSVEPISRFPRLAWEGLAPTLRAGTASDKGGHTAARPIHPKFPRVITVREAARLQSFPDWFQFDKTKWRALRQVGNAVPPLLAFTVGKQVMQTISASVQFV